MIIHVVVIKLVNSLQALEFQLAKHGETFPRFITCWVRKEHNVKYSAKLNDIVALLADLPEAKLARGQVGTVVDELSKTKLLVEFSDDEGKAYSITTIPVSYLLVLQYLQEVA